MIFHLLYGGPYERWLRLKWLSPIQPLVNMNMNTYLFTFNFLN